jgi:hypothetical protein
MPPIDPPPENLTKDLIQHLSKEIETTSHNIMLFRTKIGFALLIGPFLVLGSLVVSAKGQPIVFNLRGWGWLAVAVIALCYFGIAFIGAEIEAGNANQSNRYRDLIVALRNDPSLEIKQGQLKATQRMRAGYMGAYCLLFLSVVATVFIVKNIGTPEPSTRSTSGATQEDLPKK